MRLLPKPGARDHHPRIEAGEQRRDPEHRGDRGECEREAAAASQREQHRERERCDAEDGDEERSGEAAVVAVDCDGDGPGEESGADDGRDQREPAGGSCRPLAKLAGRADREIRRAVVGEEEHDRDPAEHGVGVEEVGEVAREIAARVDRDAVQEGREADSPDERGSEAPDRVGPRPDRAPARAAGLGSPLEREDADDQEEEHEQQRQIEAREHRRVPGRKGGEGGSTRHHEPHLVAVPDRPDRLEHGRAVGVVSRQERQQHADAEVESLEQEVAAPEDGDKDEPEVGESHDSVNRPGRGSWRPRSPRPAPAGRERRSAASARCRPRAAARRARRTSRG